MTPPTDAPYTHSPYRGGTDYQNYLNIAIVGGVVVVIIATIVAVVVNLRRIRRRRQGAASPPAEVLVGRW
jgi:hypothetical protein